MDNKFFDELKEKIQVYFEKAGSHAFDHTQRVYNVALRIAKKEKIDFDVIKAAVLLHDVARLKEDNKEVDCHADEGARMAENILKQLKFPKDKIKDVCYAIKVHRHSKGIKAETKEAQIIQDADRLDALGAITIARMFVHSGKIGRPIYDSCIPIEATLPGTDMPSAIHGFHNRILVLKPETFNTKEARKIAEKRYKFVEEFLDRFMKEWEGKE